MTEEARKRALDAFEMYVDYGSPIIETFVIEEIRKSLQSPVTAPSDISVPPEGFILVSEKIWEEKTRVQQEVSRLVEVKE